MSLFCVLIIFLIQISSWLDLFYTIAYRDLIVWRLINRSLLFLNIDISHNIYFYLIIYKNFVFKWTMKGNI